MKDFLLDTYSLDTYSSIVKLKIFCLLVIMVSMGGGGAGCMGATKKPQAKRLCMEVYF